MFAERIRRIKAVWEDQKRSVEVYRRFIKYFDVFMNPTGVLVPLGVELDPLAKGFFSLGYKDFFRQAKKLRQGKDLSESDRRLVRERAWGKAVGGHYVIAKDADEVNISIMVDSEDLLEHWKNGGIQIGYWEIGAPYGFFDLEAKKSVLMKKVNCHCI